MRRIANPSFPAFAIAFGLGVVFTPATASAQNVAKPPERGARFHLAAGASLGFQNRKEYGASDFSRVYPEIVAYGYFGGFMGPLWLRPGVRLAYVTEQAEMPQATRVEERDFVYSGELGFVYDWYVIPSLTVGGGAISRRIKLVTKEPVQDGGGRIGGSESLPLLYAQGGVGVPLFSGFAVVEPFYRYSWVERDSRITYTYGLEVTLQIL